MRREPRPGPRFSLLASARNCRADSRIISAIRIFSGQDRAFRAFCHRACLSSNRWISLIQELGFKTLPCLGETMLCRQRSDLGPGDASRFQKRQNAREILGPAHTECDHGEMVCPHDPERNAFKRRRKGRNRR